MKDDTRAVLVAVLYALFFWAGLYGVITTVGALVPAAKRTVRTESIRGVEYLRIREPNGNVSFVPHQDAQQHVTNCEGA